ncbi:MAG: hypothetical protein ACRDGT_06320 [Candidatus Limnocylindria bacterium]
MVSSAIEMKLPELRRTLERIRREHGKDPEYRRLRKAFPKTWPL